jgi:hypothetical protein
LLAHRLISTSDLCSLVILLSLKCVSLPTSLPCARMVTVRGSRTASYVSHASCVITQFYFDQASSSRPTSCYAPPDPRRSIHGTESSRG